jgi:Spy/CpxP family protein refolding chaperone
MKNTMRIFAVAALVVVTAMSMAQGRGGGMQMFGRGGGSMSMLLGRSDVQGELKLSDDQKAKLDEQRQAMRDNMRSMFQNGGGGGDQEAMRKQMTDMMQKSEKDALAVLDDGQKKRLKELWIQRSGNGVIANEDMQKELGLSDDQKAKVKSLTDAQQAANTEIFQKMRDGSLDRSELQPLMEKNTKTLNEELGKVLTSDQAAKLASMKGAEFKFDDSGGGR